jgi:DNA-binding NarL/FixJ family response regulator
MISIAVIEDIRDIREIMTEYLNNQQEFLCKISVGSVEDFLNNLNTNISIDVILLDIGLPGISGLAAIKIIKEKLPETEILILTIHDDSEKIFQAISSGVSGYLLKNTPLEKIKEAIVDVNNGGSQMSSSIARKVFNYFSGISFNSNNHLTAREKEIVAGLVDGLSYKMIAANLGITVATIKTHAKNIYRKLQVHSKSEIVAKSFRGEI